MVISILKSALENLSAILNSIEPPPNFSVTPPPLVPLSQTRGGVSSFRALSEVIRRKRDELGLPTGPLPDGTTNYDEKIIEFIIEAILKEITENAKIESVDYPGTQVTVAGGNVGGPFVAYGTTITFSNGGALIS
jgi:hypothetical protein